MIKISQWFRGGYVKSAVRFTLFFNDSMRIIRSSLALKAAVALWIINYAIGYSEINDSNLWLIFYALDVTAVITGCLASHYLGFSGFFVLTLLTSFAFLASWVSQFSRYVTERQSSFIEFGPLSKFPGIDIGVTFYVDYISYGFALLTSIISFCIYIYAYSYMRFEKNIISFLAYFKLFGWSMILLVISGSWFTLLLGWELIGITSFLLINF